MMFSMSTIKMSAWDVFKGSLDNEKRLEASSIESYKTSTPFDYRSTRYGLNLGLFAFHFGVISKKGEGV